MTAKRKMPVEIARAIESEYSLGGCPQCRGYGHGCGGAGAGGVTIRSLAEKYGVSKSAVHRVLNGEIEE